MAVKKIDATDETSIELEVLQEENARLEAENALLRETKSVEAATKFTHNKKVYEFMPKGFMHNGSLVKADDVRKDSDIQKHLVESKSGLIRLEIATQEAEGDE